MITLTGNMPRIYGIEYEETGCPEHKIWQFKIRNPFRENNQWKIGLNEKFLREAIKKGIALFEMTLGESKVEMFPPDEKYLKIKDKRKEFEWKKSIFENGLEYKIYHFKV